MTGKKHVVAYKIPNTKTTNSFPPSTCIQVCLCGKNLFVIVGRYRKSKDILYIYPNKYENARIYKNHEFGIFSLKNELDKNAKCSCDSKFINLDFLDDDKDESSKVESNSRSVKRCGSSFIIKVEGNKKNVTRKEKTKKEKTKKPELTVERKLAMSLDDIIKYYE